MLRLHACVFGRRSCAPSERAARLTYHQPLPCPRQCYQHDPPARPSHQPTGTQSPFAGAHVLPGCETLGRRRRGKLAGGIAGADRRPWASGTSESPPDCYKRRPIDRPPQLAACIGLPPQCTSPLRTRPRCRLPTKLASAGPPQSTEAGCQLAQLTQSSKHGSS